MANESNASEPQAKRRRVLIISGDESIIDEIQRNSQMALCKSMLIDTFDEEIRATPSKKKETKTKTKTKATLRCTICDSPASGFNFDVISCESCKSFFRRNALKNPPLECSHQGQCDLTLELRRRCSACRLKKCFEHGMKKERLLIAEHKAETRREKQQPVTTNNVVSRPSWSILDQELFLFSECLPTTPSIPTTNLLNADDLQRLESIQTLYQQRIELARDGLPWNPSMHAMTFLQKLNSHSVPLIRLLTFFKHIPEFNQLNADDRVTLIKFNLLPLLCLNCTLSYDASTEQIAETESDVPWDSSVMQSVYGLDGYQQMKGIFDRFLSIANYDQKLVQLALVTFILTKGFSPVAAEEPILNDELAVYRAQNYYAELLWKYLETIYGFAFAIDIFNKLIRNFLLWQRIQINLRHHIEQSLLSTDTKELVPFMKALLHLDLDH